MPNDHHLVRILDTLALPDRILHALQVNLRGGNLPPKEDDGHSYFKIPATRF